jgi:hypothetical protein
MDEARVQLTRAISIVETGEMPIAAWRVAATAAEFFDRIGDGVRAASFQRRCEDIIHTLAATFDKDDPLRTSLVERYASSIRSGGGPADV